MPSISLAPQGMTPAKSSLLTNSSKAIQTNNKQKKFWIWQETMLFQNVSMLMTGFLRTALFPVTQYFCPLTQVMSLAVSDQRPTEKGQGTVHLLLSPIRTEQATYLLLIDTTVLYSLTFQMDYTIEGPIGRTARC